MESLLPGRSWLHMAALCSTPVVMSWDDHGGYKTLCDGMSMRPCWIWYIMVSWAMSRRCSRLVYWSFLIMEVGLLWRLSP